MNHDNMAFIINVQFLIRVKYKSIVLLNEDLNTYQILKFYVFYLHGLWLINLFYHFHFAQGSSFILKTNLRSNRSWGWRQGSMVKSICWICRESMFNLLHLQVSHADCSSSSREPMITSCIRKHESCTWYTYICIYRQHIHTNLK